MIEHPHKTIGISLVLRYVLIILMREMIIIVIDFVEVPALPVGEDDSPAERKTYRALEETRTIDIDGGDNIVLYKGDRI